MKRSVLVLAVATALLAACGSSAGTSGTTTPTAAAATPSVSAIASCDELKVAAAHLTTFLHYVALNVGTDNDSSSYFTEMRDTVASIQAAQGVCATDAKAQLTALAAGVETLAQAYRSGTGADVIASDKAAIAAFLVLGKAAYSALGMDPSPWDTAPRYAV